MMLFPDVELDQLNQDVRNARARLVQALRTKGAVITVPYSFEDHSGNIYQLQDLFGSQRDLIVIHNMGSSCKYCTLWADGINGLLPHLESRCALVLINSDSIQTQKEFAISRRWNMKMMRDTDLAFTTDMGFAIVRNGKHHLQPGFSTFYKYDDGVIIRVAADSFGPGDSYMPVFPMFELLRDGEAAWSPQYSYPRPHSEI